jgi:hypothetical protein
MTLETMALGGLVVGFVTYATLSIFFVYGWGRRITGRAALIASAATTLWFGVFLTLGQRPITDGSSAAYAPDSALTRILGVGFAHLRDPAYSTQSSIAILTAVGFVISLLVPAESANSGRYHRPPAFVRWHRHVGTGRNETRAATQWNIKYLVVDPGAVFAYGRTIPMTPVPVAQPDIVRTTVSFTGRRTVHCRCVAAIAISVCT